MNEQNDSASKGVSEAAPELKPCPFCGKTPQGLNKTAYDNPRFYSVVCNGCCSIAMGETPLKVIARWNARVHQPEQNLEDKDSVSPKPKALSHSSVVIPQVSSESAARHAFDPIGNGVDECECGLTRSAPIHLSDDVVDDRYIPFERPSTSGVLENPDRGKSSRNEPKFSESASTVDEAARRIAEKIVDRIDFSSPSIFSLRQQKVECFAEIITTELFVQTTDAKCPDCDGSGTKEGYGGNLRDCVFCLGSGIASNTVSGVLAVLETIDTTHIAAKGLSKEATAISTARVMIDRLLAASPVQPEVSKALEELREMFPDFDCQVQHRASTAYPQRFQIIIHSRVPSDIPCQYKEESDTLSEAMAKVREWKEQTNAEGK